MTLLLYVAAEQTSPVTPEDGAMAASAPLEWRAKSFFSLGNVLEKKGKKSEKGRKKAERSGGGKKTSSSSATQNVDFFFSQAIAKFYNHASCSSKGASFVAFEALFFSPW